MKKINIFLLLSLSISILMFNACKQDNNDDDDVTDWQQKMNELQVPENFNYESTRHVDLEIKLPFTIDYSEYRATVKIYTSPPELGGELLNTGAVDLQGIYRASLLVPVYLNEVFVWSEYGSATIAIQTSSNKSVLEGGIDFGDGIDTLPPVEIEESYYLKQQINNYLQNNIAGRNNSAGVNIIQNGDFSENDFGTITNWTSPMELDGRWYKTNYIHNSSGQYNDEGNDVLIISRPGGIFVSGGVAQLVNASPGDRITFSADLKSFGNASNSNRVWLFIIPRNANGSSIAYYSREIYPVSNSTHWRHFQIGASMPYGTESVQILLWNWVYGGSVLWDNVVVTGPVTDSDGDGVDDENDAYPNDPLRAYNIYYPDFNSFGSLAFEDNWPGKGDYDFNDFVVDYQYKQVTNASNELVDLYGKFVIRAIGASFTNGFGVMMGMLPSDVQSVTGISIVDDYINLLANNTEDGQQKATIIITDNAFTQLPHPGGGTGVNTTPGQTYVEPDTMNIAVTFNEPIALSTAGTPPYNPFIIVDQIRGREVHLPDNPPSSLASTDYFDTEHDDSNPGIGRYYKTENNLPWAINVPAEFDYPVEKAVIIQAYLHFADWAESAGESYEDWYLDLSGYRNSTHIYQVPE